MLRRSVPTPWAAKGAVMRAVVEAAGRPAARHHRRRAGASRTTASWALVLPDPAEAVTHLWAEAGNDSTAAELLERWAEVVSRAGT